ncbi:TPA: hypothetical protein MW242_002920 [Acinetobacter baumannii]|nr:hypothetical protein [Acinetobacter baumannii]
MTTLVNRIRAMNLNASLRKFTEDELNENHHARILIDSFEALKSADVLKLYDNQWTKEEAEENEANKFINALLELSLQATTLSGIDRKIKSIVNEFKCN